MTKRSKAIEAWQIADAARLKQIFDSRSPKISQLKFGEEFGIGTQGMVWQYLTGMTPLNIDAATNFAIGLNVPIDAFSATIAGKIADAYALTVRGRQSLDPIAEAFAKLTSVQQNAVMAIISSYGVAPPAPTKAAILPVEITSTRVLKESSSSG